MTHASTLSSSPSPIERVEAALARLPRLRQRAEDFTPHDTIPWEAQAEQLLRCRLGAGFIGLRPPAQVEREVAAAIDRLGLRPGHAILDLGCGPGLHGNRLGARGLRVTGIDIAAAVVAHAQAEADARGLPCRYLRGSFLELTFAHEFDAALLTNSIVNHLAPAELEALLRGVHRALLPGGRFVLEVGVLPRGFAERPVAERRTLFTLPRSPWSDEPHDWLERHLAFPELGQRVVHHVIVPASGEPREHWSRFELHPRERIDALLQAGGFRVVARLDRDLRSPLSPASEQAWFVAEAGPGRG